MRLWQGPTTSLSRACLRAVPFLLWHAFPVPSAPCRFTPHNLPQMTRHAAGRLAAADAVLASVRNKPHDVSVPHFCTVFALSLPKSMSISASCFCLGRNNSTQEKYGNSCWQHPRDKFCGVDSQIRPRLRNAPKQQCRYPRRQKTSCQHLSLKQ